jgi:hypothetical protein
MAEALGIASSIVGIVALADVVASKGIRLYTTIKDCPKEIKILVDEVDGLCGLLGTLKRRYGALMGSQSVTGFSVHSESLLQGCEETLDMMDRILTKSKARTGETWANMVKRVKWKYRKDDVLELLERVERHKSSFQLALSLDRMCVPHFIQVHVWVNHS